MSGEAETKPEIKADEKKSPTPEVIYAELEKVLKINMGEPIVESPAPLETIKEAVQMLYENYNTEGAKADAAVVADAAVTGGLPADKGEVEAVVKDEDGDGGPPADKGEVEAVVKDEDGDRGAREGGRRRSKRKGRKGSRKSKKGGNKQQQQSQSSQNGGRRSRRNRRKYSRRSKH